MIRSRAGAGIALAAWFASLSSGCATRPLLVESLPRGAPPAARELGDTPFFPQRVHQCGPAALATVLVASKLNITPDELEPLVYLPKKHGSLQIEMQAVPRKYDRLAYVLGSNLDDIVNELNAGRPVLVLHNYGLPLWPRWHYAVVIGYDAPSDTMLLRSGTIRRQVLSARNFMRAWDNGNRWAMVVLQPGECLLMARAQATWRPPPHSSESPDRINRGSLSKRRRSSGRMNRSRGWVLALRTIEAAGWPQPRATTSRPYGSMARSLALATIWR